MANVDRARKLLVRTALVTSSTIATLIGAQNLALQDTSKSEPALTPTAEPAGIPTTALVAPVEPTAITQASPTIAINHAAPNVVILRRAGQAGPIQQSAPAVQAASIQPPVPVEAAAPAPVIVQGEAPPPIIVQQGSSSGSQPSTTTQTSR
ncbi:MAG: hypothetical protein KJ065_09950 [Anaerolineae bacterium]|nr:hypothetical protein [Anaerolineae bacterium]